jgi:hypothetical protein
VLSSFQGIFFNTTSTPSNGGAEVSRQTNQRGPDDELTVIVAGNYPEFHHYCYVHGINPRSRDLLYVRDSQVLRGINRPLVIKYIGTYQQRPDLHEINQNLDIIIKSRRQDKK